MRATIQTALVSVIVLSGARDAIAQHLGTRNSAFLIPIPNAAALGAPSGFSLGVSKDSEKRKALFVGLPLAGGAFRLGLSWEQRSVVGGSGDFGRLFGQRSLGFLGRATVGGDATFSYVGSGFFRPWSAVAHVATPIGLELGSVKGISLQPFVAPFFEVGSSKGVIGYCDQFQCSGPIEIRRVRTSTAGSAIGARLTAGRFAIDAAIRDVFTSGHYRGENRAMAGLSFRF